MVNFNGKLIVSGSDFINHNNRGLRYGDALFETIRTVNGTIFFWEEHYLRLMASMRILRMEIPMRFTMEALEAELLEVLRANKLEKSPARVRLTVFRNPGGLYTPRTNEVSYIMEAGPLDSPFYLIDTGDYEVELFKDFFVNPDLLSSLKTNNKILNVVGSIFAKENGYQNCLLLNNAKQVVEALNGNFFLVSGNTVKTPPLKDGCLNGIVRKKIMELVDKLAAYELIEASISPFDLQKADELFLTNTIVGIQPITKYRKKQFGNTIVRELLGKLNAVARFSNENA
ncbi:aminotransferase class IV [Flavobacteriaceae bacterium TP-CH-4]|uniref:branched-chain-amino-acid transaminase n=1 Tax=Pelagihabitans pacificus TaxID=2696054 RepID=A0A967AW78_9FLAO|nr:aminotransferase class IV [Pelagihabitans pacificus]NHF60280.1 aminotransferase class IV [Pelagihabitans pacificus]